MKEKRILVVTEEWAGSGHRMAAEALVEALKHIHSDLHVDIVWGLQTASPALREMSRFFYLKMLRYSPWLWQRMHDHHGAWAAACKKPLASWLSGKILTSWIEQEAPDIVVATHAYCFAALAEAKQKATKPFRLVGVPTDFCVHHFWIHPQADAYILAHPQLEDEIRSHPAMQTTPILHAGIPIRRNFYSSSKREKAKWKESLGLHPQHFTVLLSGGEGGYGAMEEVLQGLLGETEPLQIVVITGRNTELQERLRQAAETLSGPSPHVTVVKGYEESIWEWMAAADVFITKPGGISCAEALAVRTPLILHHPLPGQEQRNAAFLLDQQAALFAQSVEQIPAIVQQLRRSPDQYSEMTRRMSEIGRPHAADQIAQFLLTL
ncbi:glycosyl transferase [Brevibacillus ruminantium]|uniref:Glycosyl transferase n=1 Tax=Brevibacillus ruminantium TaxID=2950604 RepID=A0ABY4WJG2_9BACL|nr:glycosyltransferase [Brevibacillus ruminantium]USG67242.1 glycosyl transferase [Brevibacillus ruminantium]